MATEHNDAVPYNLAITPELLQQIEQAKQRLIDNNFINKLVSKLKQMKKKNSFRSKRKNHSQKIE